MIDHAARPPAQPDEWLVKTLAARRAGMRTLWESGLDRMWQGQTTLEELVRVLGERVLGERVLEDGSTLPNRPSVMLVPEEVRSANAIADGAAATPAPSEKVRVLVADDDAQMRRLVRSVLERDGLGVTEATDGLDALDQIAERRPDLVVIDMDMPRLDGLGVLEELRASMQTAQLPVIMLTARTDETESRALELGAHDYLTKPVRPTALSARVKAVLRRART